MKIYKVYCKIGDFDSQEFTYFILTDSSEKAFDIASRAALKKKVDKSFEVRELKILDSGFILEDLERYRDQVA